MVAFKRLVMILMAGLMALAGLTAASAQSPQYDLLKAIEDEDIKEATDLLARGISPNTRRRSSRIPALLIANDTGNLALLKLLLDYNANPNIADPDRGETVLMRRAVAGHVAGIQLMLSYKADPNRADIGQETALMKAVRARKFKAAQILLEAGADPNVQDLTGKTALEYAKLSRSRRMVRVLQEAGATY